MAENFNPDNAVAVTDSPEGHEPVSSNFNIDNASPVDSTSTGTSPYDDFRSFKPTNQPEEENVPSEGDRSTLTPKKPKESTLNSNPKTFAQSKTKDGVVQEDRGGVSPSGKPYKTTLGPSSYPDEGWLNAVVHTGQGAAWSMVAKPVLGMKDPDMDKYLSDIEKQHPIASTVGGTAPYIASAFLFPESLIPNVYGRMAVQFGAVSGVSALGRARVDDAMKPLPERALDVTKETAKGAAFSPIWAKAQTLQFIGRPFATALTRAGVIGAGSATMSTFFGDNITEAFKQGGILGALSLISEGPHLGKTVLGRGIINHANNIYADMAVKSGLPEVKMDPESPNFSNQIVDVTKGLASSIKGIDKPQIIAAAVKLPNGVTLEAPDHEDALHKIGETKDTMAEGKDFEAGFTVQDPNGKTRFITRAEAKQEFGITHSEEVTGLNETKFKPAPEPLKIVNPETLARIGNESGQMNVHLIPGVAETAEILSRSTAEMKEKLAPYTVGQEGKFTAEVLREQLGILARANDITEQAHVAAKKFFDKATKESIIETYTKAERGESQDSPELQKIYDTLQQELKDEADNIRALGTGKLENAIENYLAHVWEDPKKAQQLLGQIFGKRPFQGPKSFLKKRSINDFQAGIEAGLTPVSWNPVDLTMIKLREMRKYVMAQRTLAAIKKQGLIEYIPIGKQAKDNWIKLNDSVSTIHKSPMIAVNEAFDKKMMEGLEKVARDLGIDVETKMKLRGGKALGLSRRGEEAGGQISDDPLMNVSHNLAKPGSIKRAFATPESVLAHEIGHQLDEMYGLKEKFVNEPYFKKELRALSDLLYEGENASNYFKTYVRKSSEKMAHMLEAYIHAPAKFKEVAPNTFKAFEEFLNRRPELKPITDIKPSMVLGTREGEIYAGGLVIAGHLYAQPDAARIINNYLSPGLANKSYLYDMYRGAGNTLNQFQLGISAFHLGFTSMDATISKFALGINKLSTGDFAGGIKEFATAPFAPITNIMQGRELLQSWYGKDNGPLTNTIADLMASGGGRAKMDKFYATGAKESMMKALKEGKIATGALKIPYYIVEQMAKPIMEYIVPRQKMGVFMDLMKMEMERNPHMSHEQMRGVAQRAWDSVDNRMGQVVYDNLFWNRTTKDLAMASVRSLGWNLGTIRELGGGTKDVIGNINDLIHGKGTKMSYRTAYVMALPIVTGLYGAIYQYLHTGQGPQELKDYFFPKNGAIDNKGQPARVSLPTYMKDIYHYTTNPVQTVINKFSPVNNAALEMLTNKDFYGTEIRNMDDPIMQQIFDESAFLGSQFIPFGFRNQGRDTRKTAGSKVEPFIGITPAPYDINMTAAEKEAYELNKGHIPVGSRTKDQSAHAQAKSKLRSDYMANKDISVLNDGVDQKIITAKEKRDIVKQSAMSNLERLTKHSTAEEVERILHKATASERPELEKILKNKRINKKNRGTWTQTEEEMYDRSFNSKE